MYLQILQVQRALYVTELAKITIYRNCLRMWFYILEAEIFTELLDLWK